MNVPYGVSGLSRVLHAERVSGGPGGDNGAVRRFRCIGTVLALTVFFACGNPAAAATLANHMDYPAEGFALWCQDSQQQWVEHKLAGHLEMEQKVSVPLPEEPCFFLEVDMGDYLLSFPIKQELEADDLLDMGCMPDPALEVYRNNEPLFITDGGEKDRNLARDPDRNPPETVAIGGLLETFRGGMSEAECLAYGIPLRREVYNDSQSFSIKTSLSSAGAIWQGIISRYKDAETEIIGLSLTTPLSRQTLETLFAELAAKGYRHTVLGDNGPEYLEEPLLSTDLAVRGKAVGELLAQLKAPNADLFDAHFEPGTPECREEAGEEAPSATAQAAGTEGSCRDLSADIRIAPGSDVIELFLQEGKTPAE